MSDDDDEIELTFLSDCGPAPVDCAVVFSPRLAARIDALGDGVARLRREIEAERRRAMFRVVD